MEKIAKVPTLFDCRWPGKQRNETFHLGAKSKLPTFTSKVSSIYANAVRNWAVKKTG